MYLYLYKQSDILALKRNRLSAQFLLLYIYFFKLCSSTQSNNVTNNNHPLRKYRTISIVCFGTRQTNCARENVGWEREHRDNVEGSIPKTTKGKKRNITVGNINVRKAQLVVIFGLDYRWNKKEMTMVLRTRVFFYILYHQRSYTFEYIYRRYYNERIPKAIYKKKLSCIRWFCFGIWCFICKHQQLFEGKFFSFFFAKWIWLFFLFFI